MNTAAFVKPLVCWTLAGGLAWGVCPLHAALLVESRHTLLQVTTQFGYLGGVTTDTPSSVHDSLLSDLQPRLSDSESGGGALGDTSWVAAYEYELLQSLEYVPGGLAAAGSVSVYAFAGDQGVASVDATSGNRLELVFRLDAPEAYRFSGILQDLTRITFERSLGGGTWTPVVEPGIGGFDHVLDLPAGQYRLSGIGGGYHDASQGSGSAWAFQLVTIPEPSCLAAVSGASLLVAAAGRRLLRGSAEGPRVP